MTRVLVTCEHGGRDIPLEHASLFAQGEDVLASHRGWDAGALALAEALARALDAPLLGATVSRLLVDLNRSPTNRAVFSEFTRGLPAGERQTILDRYHTPHRNRVHEAVARLARGGEPVVHLGVHTFTPCFNGVVRRTEVALLYDPRRRGERELCHRWAAELKRALPGRVVHRNAPYRGAADGLTTWLRRGHPASEYLGVEIEVSQGLLSQGGDVHAALAGDLAGSFRAACGLP